MAGRQVGMAAAGGSGAGPHLGSRHAGGSSSRGTWVGLGQWHPPSAAAMGTGQHGQEGWCRFGAFGRPLSQCPPPQPQHPLPMAAALASQDALAVSEGGRQAGRQTVRWVLRGGMPCSDAWQWPGTPPLECHLDSSCPTSKKFLAMSLCQSQKA